MDAQECLVELKGMADSLTAKRQPWIEAWDEVIEYCNPTRSFYAPDDETRPRTRKTLFNSRAVLDLKKAASGFQGYVANRRSDWLMLQLDDPELMNEPGISDWLEQCNKTLVAHFNRSKFYEYLGELCMDAFSVGTAVGYSEEIDDGNDVRINYQARHPKAIRIAENGYGEVDTVFEDVWMTHKGVLDMFGNSALSERQRDNAKRKPYEGTIIRHAVLPMDEKYRALSRRPVSASMPWASVWYCDGEANALDAGGYWDFPYTIWRFTKNPGDWYGGSPGLDCIGDVLASNQMSRSRIRLGNLIADPPLMVDEDLEGQDDLIPGAHIYRTRPEHTMEPVQLGANYPITLDNEKHQDEVIDEHFFIPLFQMLQNAETRTKTAREVVEMVGEKAAVLGNVSGRFESECLGPTIRRTFNILMRKGKIPAPPEAFIDARKKGAVVKIEYLGLLAQMQKRYYQSSGIGPAMELINTIVQIEGTAKQTGSEVLDNIDLNVLMRTGLESVGTSATVIRELPDVEEIRQQRAQAQQEAQAQQQQMMQEQLLAQNADKLGKKPEQGSPIQALAEAQAGQR